MKKQQGVWLDIRNAHIVTIKEGNAQMATIQSEIDEFNPKGGSGTSTPYGSQDSISESSYLERKKQQTRKFFDTIFTRIKDADELVLMGPAEMRVGLEKYLDDTPAFTCKLMGNESADSMTENQIKAAVKEYFTNNEN